MDFDLDIRPITYAEVDPKTGYLGLQVQLVGARANNASGRCRELLPYGYFALPADPAPSAGGGVDASQSAQGFVVWLGGEPFVMPMSHPNAVAKLPNLTKGDIGLATNAGCFFKLGANGKITRYTTDDNTVTGQSVYDQITPEGYLFASPYGLHRHDATGVHITTPAGARLSLGAIYGMPGPLAGLASYAKIKAATIALNASIVKLGGPLAAPLATALALSNFMHAFASALAAPAAGPVALTAALAAAASPVPLNVPLYELLATKNVLGS